MFDMLQESCKTSTTLLF